VTQESVTITAAPIIGYERLDFLPRMMGRHYLKGEALVFAWARRLSRDYDGGEWEFFELSNGGGYLAPKRAGSLLMEWGPSGYRGTLTADAFGIVVSLFALCHLAEMTRDDQVIDCYHLLRAFALEHHERNQIFRAID
jgi:predicted outer membrane lipoprotein